MPIDNATNYIRIVHPQAAGGLFFEYRDKGLYIFVKRLPY